MTEQENNSPTGARKYFEITESTIRIGWGTIGIVIPLICSVSFFLGTIKYDNDKIILSENNIALKDTIKEKDNLVNLIENKITKMQIISDSAHNILGHMPYDEMNLDTNEFRLIQTNIEAAGAALNLIK